MTESTFGNLMLVTGALSSIITLVVFLLLYQVMRQELAQDRAEHETLNIIVESLEQQSRC
jgi:hypothetical protein